MLLCAWVYGCDPGKVSDGSRLALIYQTLSIECPSFNFFWHVLCVFVLFRFHALVGAFFVDVPLIFSCPADHVVPE